MIDILILTFDFIGRKGSFMGKQSRKKVYFGIFKILFRSQRRSKSALRGRFEIVSLTI